MLDERATVKRRSSAGATQAVVLRGTGGVWVVRTSDGELHESVLRGRLKQETGLKLAVGDVVVVAPTEPDGQWTIDEILPRRSALTRRAPGRRVGERVVAANVDQVMIVFAAAQPEPHRGMIDRFLVIAEGSHLAPRLVLNKVDLVDPESARAHVADYDRAGYPIHFTSARAGLGMSTLRDALAGCATVVTGPSGVGKSSLLNALYPGLNLRVGEISASVNKGRHTTVGALAHPLPDGGYVVDTPGLREVGLWGVSLDTLDQCFPEFRPYIGHCRFVDCTHLVEPGCALRAAVAQGDVSARRYESYVKLRDEEVEQRGSGVGGRGSARN